MILFVLSFQTLSAPVHAHAAASGWRLMGSSPYLSRNAKDPSDHSYGIGPLMVDHGVLYAGTGDGVYFYGKGAWYLVGGSKYFETSSLINVEGTLCATFGNLSGVAALVKGKWYRAGKSQNMSAGPLAGIGHVLYTGTDRGVYVLTRNGSWHMVGKSANLSGGDFGTHITFCGYPVSSASVIVLVDMDACSNRLNHSPWKCRRL